MAGNRRHSHRIYDRSRGARGWRIPVTLNRASLILPSARASWLNVNCKVRRHE
jgi:hypothetical protein